MPPFVPPIFKMHGNRRKDFVVGWETTLRKIWEGMLETQRGLKNDGVWIGLWMSYCVLVIVISDETPRHGSG